MDPVLTYAQSQLGSMIAFLRELAECESPSDNPAAVARFQELLADRLSGLGQVRIIPSDTAGPHLQCEFDLPGADKDGQILLLGHSDTVWPVGTLQKMPFREAEGRVWGPGVLDMKGGIVLCVFAARAIRDLGLPMKRKVLLQLNSDEETGSDASRSLTEAEARRSVAVLVPEPGTGLEGKAKTARKGIGDFTVTVRGKAAHSGLDFTAGASAVLELARQIEVISRFTDLERGITVNPGVIAGGSRPNVVAAEARVECDMRVMTVEQAAEVEARFRALTPFDPRCRIEVTGGLNRPPMERRFAVGLYEKAQAAAREMGIELEESLSGGGSDGNFTAALGVPTLDGIGPVGEGAHAPHESILVDRLPDRMALLAKLMQAI